MINNLEIRESRPSDLSGIERLYADAFPDENLIPLVRELLTLEHGVLSLVAVKKDTIVGHLSFTHCHVEGDTNTVALLAPLAVTPTFQKQEIGSTLVRTGFTHLENARIDCVFVLGDPAYYKRFGFKAEDKVIPPYPLPTEWQGAWQSIALDKGKTHLEGTLSVPEPWRHAELWA